MKVWLADGVTDRPTCGAARGMNSLVLMVAGAPARSAWRGADAYGGFGTLYAPDRQPAPITEAPCLAEIDATTSGPGSRGQRRRQ